MMTEAPKREWPVAAGQIAKQDTENASIVALHGNNEKRFATKRYLARPMPGSFIRFAFSRNLLPDPASFYASEDIKLLGMGGWRNALCPFHKDTKPSLRVFFETGAFRCMVCGAHGGDVLAFFMLRHDVRFIEAAKALGAWEMQT